MARAQVWQRDSVLSRLRTIYIVGDSSGFLWCSTETGVFRYDGHQAVPLADLLTPGSPRLPAGGTRLVRGTDGIIWCGTQDGLYRLRLPERRLERVPLPPLPSGQTSIDVLSVHPRTGHVWVIYGSLYSVVLVNGQVVGPPVRLPDSVYGTDFDPHADGERLFCVTGGVWHLDAHGRLRQLTPAKQPFRWRVPGTDGRWQADLGALYEAADPVADLAIGSLGRCVQRWDTSPFQNYLFRPVVYGNTWYWLSSNGQLVALTPSATGQPPRIELPAAPERLPPTCGIRTIANGVLWASDPVAGSYWMALGHWPARALTTRGIPASNASRLSYRSIRRLPPPDGRLLVATYSTLLTQAADSPSAPLRPLLLRQQPALGLEVHDILRTRSGQLLVADETGLPAGELDVRQRSYRPYAWTDARNISSCGSCLLEDRAGQLWAGTTRGLYCIDAARRTLTRYHDADPGYPLHVCLIEQLVEAPAGVLWAATDHGLYRLTVATGELRHYGPAEPDPTRRLPSVLTLCVQVPHPDSVWVGTRDHGLLLLHPERGVVRRLSTAEGLPHAAVASILPDARAGVLWLGTFAGLARYTVRTGQLRRFGAADGLAATDLNRQSAWRDPVSGWVYFGGVGGLTRLAPVGPREPAAPRLLLTSVRQHSADRDTVLTRYLDGTPPPSGVQLAAGDSFLELTLALTDHASPVPSRYVYRLVGVADKHFRAVPGGYRLRLDHVAPGEYVIEIKGQTGHGLGARNVLRVPLRVAGYWWQSPWTWAAGAGLLAALAATAVYVWQRQRTNRLLREQALRARIAADLHDDVGSLLSQIALQTDLLHEGIAPAGWQNTQLTEIADTSRMAVRQLNDVVWSLDSHNDTLAALLARLRDYAHDVLHPTGRPVHFQTGDVPAVDLPAAMRRHLYLIYKEALHNILKYAPAGVAVTVRLHYFTDYLELTIANDGPPLVPGAVPAAGRASGHGLRNIRARAAALGGQSTAEARPEGGFLVCVKVPFRG